MAGTNDLCQRENLPLAPNRRTITSVNDLAQPAAIHRIDTRGSRHNPKRLKAGKRHTSSNRLGRVFFAEGDNAELFHPATARFPPPPRPVLTFLIVTAPLPSYIPAHPHVGIKAR